MVLLQLILLQVVCTSLLSMQPKMAGAVIGGSDVQGRLLNISESSAVNYAWMGCVICLLAVLTIQPRAPFVRLTLS